MHSCPCLERNFLDRLALHQNKNKNPCVTIALQSKDALESFYTSALRIYHCLLRYVDTHTHTHLSGWTNNFDDILSLPKWNRRKNSLTKQKLLQISVKISVIVFFYFFFFSFVLIFLFSFLTFSTLLMFYWKYANGMLLERIKPKKKDSTASLQ